MKTNKLKKVIYIFISCIIFSDYVHARVKVDSVRYCRSKIPVICNAKTQSEYSTWEKYDVPTRHQKRTFIARYNTPIKEDVKHLVFVSDGQANEPDFDFNGITNRSWVTGKVREFRDDIDRFDRSKYFDETPNSLSARLLDGEVGTFNRQNTFAAAVWDARFHYGSSSDTLNRIVNANFEWLEGKFNSESLQSIVLAGHSRGGALMTALAKKFRDKYSHIPVMVYTLEGVPSRRRSVPPLSSTRVHNPIASGFGYSFDFEGFYERTDLLRAVNILTGRSFLFTDINTVRPMAQDNKTSDGEQEAFFDWGWLQQEWVDHGHRSFNLEWAVDYVVSDIQSYLEPLLTAAEAAKSRSAHTDSSR